jgi:hypothetical protein
VRVAGTRAITVSISGDSFIVTIGISGDVLASFTEGPRA